MSLVSSVIDKVSGLISSDDLAKLTAQLDSIKALFIGFGGFGVNSGRWLASLTNPSKESSFDIALVNSDVRGLVAQLKVQESETGHFKDWLSAKSRLFAIPLGPKATGGNGAGYNPELGKQAFEESKEEIRNLIKKYDVVVGLFGLGRGTGTGCSEPFARLIKEEGKLGLAITVLPELALGLQDIAGPAHEKMLQSIPTISIYNQTIYQNLKDKPIFESYRKMAEDSALRHTLLVLKELVQNVSAQNTDLNDLRTSCRVGNYAATGYAELTKDSEEDKEMEAFLKKLLEDPFQRSEEIIKNATRYNIQFKGPWTPNQKSKVFSKIRGDRKGVIICEGHDPDTETISASMIAIWEGPPNQVMVPGPILEVVREESFLLAASNNDTGQIEAPVPRGAHPTPIPVKILQGSNGNRETLSKRIFNIEGCPTQIEAPQLLWNKLDRVVEEYEKQGGDEKDPSRVSEALLKLNEYREKIDKESGKNEYRPLYIQNVVPSLFERKIMKSDPPRPKSIWDQAKAAVGYSIILIITQFTFTPISFADDVIVTLKKPISVQAVGNSTETRVELKRSRDGLGIRNTPIQIRKNSKKTEPIRTNQTAIKTDKNYEAKIALNVQEITELKSKLEKVTYIRDDLQNHLNASLELNGEYEKITQSLGGSNQSLKKDFDEVQEKLQYTHKNVSMLVAVGTMGAWIALLIHGMWEGRRYRILKIRRQFA